MQTHYRLDLQTCLVPTMDHFSNCSLYSLLYIHFTLYTSYNNNFLYNGMFIMVFVNSGFVTNSSHYAQK